MKKQAPFLKMYSEYTNNYKRATKVQSVHLFIIHYSLIHYSLIHYSFIYSLFIYSLFIIQYSLFIESQTGK